MKTVIEKSKQLTELLEELEKSVAYEKANHHLVKNSEFGPNIYTLFNLPDKVSVKCGRIDAIKSYINLRKIDSSTIFMAKEYLTPITDGKT